MLLFILGCGLNFHKRCAYKIPNNCTHTRRRRSATSLYPRSPTESLGHTASSAACLSDESMVCVSNNNLFYQRIYLIYMENHILLSKF